MAHCQYSKKITYLKIKSALFLYFNIYLNWYYINNLQSKNFVYVKSCPQVSLKNLTTIIYFIINYWTDYLNIQN